MARPWVSYTRYINFKFSMSVSSHSLSGAASATSPGPPPPAPVVAGGGLSIVRGWWCGRGSPPPRFRGRRAEGSRRVREAVRGLAIQETILNNGL